MGLDDSRANPAAHPRAAAHLSQPNRTEKVASRAMIIIVILTLTAITGAWWGFAYRGAQQKDMMPQTNIMGNPTGADYRQ